jgi:hypothetical protein
VPGTRSEYASCPTEIVDAPVEIVWALLPLPEQWGKFFRPSRHSRGATRIDSCRAKGLCEIWPQLLSLRLEFECTDIDAIDHKLGLNINLPFGLRVREELDCIPINRTRCKVNYRCNFGLPAG